MVPLLLRSLTVLPAPLPPTDLRDHPLLMDLPALHLPMVPASQAHPTDPLLLTVPEAPLVLPSLALLMVAPDTAVPATAPLTADPAPAPDMAVPAPAPVTADLAPATDPQALDMEAHLPDTAPRPAPTDQLVATQVLPAALAAPPTLPAEVATLPDLDPTTVPIELIALLAFPKERR